MDEEVNQLAGKVKSIIEAGGGTVLKSENWGKRKLAYEIDKEKKGTYAYLLFESDGKIIQEIERFYRLNDAVMKSMTTRMTKSDLAQTEWARRKELRSDKSEGPRDRDSERVSQGEK